MAGVGEGIDRAGLWRIRRKDRSIIEVEITSLAIHFEGRPAELVLIVDVTTVVRAERRAWESEVESAHGAGTTFHLYLPTLVTTQSTTPAHGERAPQAGGQGRVLLVEDEPALREMARRFLVRRGHEVIEAGSGAEALRRFEEAGGTDALFINMVLPGGMSGVECAAALLKRRPELPVIYTSGYNTELLP